MSLVIAGGLQQRNKGLINYPVGIEPVDRWFLE